MKTLELRSRGAARAWTGARGRHTPFVFDRGHAVEAVGVNVANVLQGFEGA